MQHCLFPMYCTVFFPSVHIVVGFEAQCAFSNGIIQWVYESCSFSLVGLHVGGLEGRLGGC